MDADIVSASPAPQAGRQPEWLLWAPVALGLSALYVPTLSDLARGIWRSEEYAHGPIVLLIVAWLVWRHRAELLRPSSAQPAAVPGVALLVVGVALYALGRSQDILMFEVGSQIPVLAGCIVALRGWRCLRKFWYPLLFLAFMVPLPGVVTDALTGPLKRYISALAEHSLYLAGYPIARNGVILTVGQYQLLVADACSGLNSMFSLAAMGLFYIYLMSYSGWFRNTLLLASILPIAFIANFARVVALVLITYHFGDGAGQGFSHGFAGVALFAVALLLMVIFDRALGSIIRGGSHRT